MGRVLKFDLVFSVNQMAAKREGERGTVIELDGRGGVHEWKRVHK